MRIILIILISALVLSFNKPDADIDYKKVFGANYTWAVNWLKQNDQLISQFALKYNIPVKELKSIVFPELIRYNKVFDAIEIESLKYLYVSEGKTYADFSVGYFQMKPSFAEKVEKDADKMFGFVVKNDDEDNRRDRVRRLTGTAEQIVYLCAFYKICEKKFTGRSFNSASEKLRIFATCYNAGYDLEYDKLLIMQSKKQFARYNYSDISLFYFEKE